jgi:hypothetical protein
MTEIPGPWAGKMLVGRMPGRGKEYTGEYEFGAIRRSGVERLVCLVQYYDLAQMTEFPRISRSSYDVLWSTIPSLRNYGLGASPT